MNNTIYEYVKNQKGQLIGCVAAVGAQKVGWSLCNAKAGDVFSKARALEIAVGRAQTNPVLIKFGKPYCHVDGQNKYLPKAVAATVVKVMEIRSVRYFKGQNPLVA